MPHSTTGVETVQTAAAQPRNDSLPCAESSASPPPLPNRGAIPYPTQSPAQAPRPFSVSTPPSIRTASAVTGGRRKGRSSDRLLSFELWWGCPAPHAAPPFGGMERRGGGTPCAETRNPNLSKQSCGQDLSAPSGQGMCQRSRLLLIRGMVFMLPAFRHSVLIGKLCQRLDTPLQRQPARRNTQGVAKPGVARDVRRVL